MKVETPVNQFDQPKLNMAPATPSCCCCCCCCLATIISTGASSAIDASHKALAQGRGRTIPAVLAASAQAIGFGILLLAAALGLEFAPSLLVGGVVALITLAAAFWMAGYRNSETAGRTLAYGGIYVGAFGAELALGIILVLFFVVPYFIFATLVTVFVIKGRLAAARRSVGIYPPPQYQAPTYYEPPAALPPGGSWPPPTGQTPVPPSSPVSPAPKQPTHYPPPGPGPTEPPSQPTSFEPPALPASPPQDFEPPSDAPGPRFEPPPADAPGPRFEPPSGDPAPTEPLPGEQASPEPPGFEPPTFEPPPDPTPPA